MTININTDITKIQAGGIRNLSKRQIKYAVLTAVAVIPVMTIAYIILQKIGIQANTAQTVSGFLGLIAGSPVAFIGFYKKGNLTWPEYQKLKKECERQEPVFYISTESPDYQSPEESIVDKSDDFSGRLAAMLIRQKKRKEEKDGKHR